MKTSREQLKMLVKECLLEILNEGLGGAQPMRSPARNPQISGTSAVSEGRRRQAFDPRLDTPVSRPAPRAPDPFHEAVKREAGGNPVMAAILADTARTTLPTMMSHGDPSSGQGSPSMISQQEQFHGTPEEVFGEAAMMRPDGSSHWADLAFAPAKKTA